jgi:uncharacterized protein YegJ (DUF2314 family)
VPITDSNGTEHFWLSKVRYADGKFTGNFTLKVLFPKMTPAEVAEAKKAMGWD